SVPALARTTYDSSWPMRRCHLYSVNETTSAPAWATAGARARTRATRARSMRNATTRPARARLGLRLPPRPQRSPALTDSLLLAAVARRVVRLAAQGVGQIIVGDVVSLEVVRVAVARAEAELLHERGRRVADVGRHGERAGALERGERAGVRG